MNVTAGLFHITKVTTTRQMGSLVNALNTNTRDGHIANQSRIGHHLWLLRVTCSWRDDAEFVRSL